MVALAEWRWRYGVCVCFRHRSIPVKRALLGVEGILVSTRTINKKRELDGLFFGFGWLWLGFRLCSSLRFFLFDRFHGYAATDHITVFTAAHVFHQNNQPTFLTLVFFTFLFRQKITCLAAPVITICFLKYKNFPLARAKKKWHIPNNCLTLLLFWRARRELNPRPTDFFAVWLKSPPLWPD